MTKKTWLGSSVIVIMVLVALLTYSPVPSHANEDQEYSFSFLQSTQSSLLISLESLLGNLSSALQLLLRPNAPAPNSIEALTFKMLALNKQYEIATPSKKQDILNQITSVAKERKTLLLTLTKQNPSNVLGIALSSSLRQSFPVSVQSLIETPITTEGELEILHADDFDTESSFIIYTLKEKTSNRLYNLHSAKKINTAVSGAQIKITGIAIDNEIVLAGDGEESLTVVSNPSNASAAAVEEQNVLVILGNFQDKNLTCSAGSISNIMFNTTNSVTDLYREMSFDNIGFYGDVVGPYNIAYDSIGTTQYSWASALDSAATADGVVVSNYRRKVYVLPSNGTGYSGYGTIGGNPSRAWIFRCDRVGVYGHELGHNVGMWHAATPSSEYGDTSDIMGSTVAGHRQVNAPHKAQMNWVPSSRVLTVASSGTYTIAMLEQSSTLPQILKIAKPDTSEHYYLGFRAGVGYDSNLNSQYLNKTNIHTWKGTSVNTFYVSSMDDGVSFSDTVNGITLKQISHTPSSATVSVTLGPVVCTPNNPSLAVSPAGQWGDPGTALSYNITLTNNNSSSCAISTFTISSALPNTSWTQSPATLTETLASGDSVTRTITVTSPSTAPAGSYTFTETAVHPSGSSYNTSASAVYNVNSVAPPDTISPTATITSPANNTIVPTGTTITIMVNASDNVGVDRVEIYEVPDAEGLPGAAAGKGSGGGNSNKPGGGGTTSPTLLCTDTTASYSCDYRFHPKKAVVVFFQAVALDAAGNIGKSQIIQVTSQ